MKKTLLGALLMLWSGSAMAGDYDWVVSKNWTPSLEDKFSEFLSIMGEAKINDSRTCKTLDECLKNPKSNPYYFFRTPNSKFLPADCADFPYALRMYFAWMEGLPFDYVSQPELVDPADPRNDLRYSKFGNKPKYIKSFKSGETHDFYKALIKMEQSHVSTATYRMDYRYQSDFYPTAIDRKNIRPGTVAYDPAGHAAIVYKIESDGRIKMMDAHPDNSVTRITYDKKFVRSRPAHGAGLRNWRPELDNRPSQDLPGFSTVQFNNNSTFQSGGFSDYYDYLRTKLAGGSLKYNPIIETKNIITELCSNLQDRVGAVNAAIDNGIDQKRQPPVLPSNIYGTHGEWESYSSPSRDARLKVAFVEMKNDIKKFFNMLENNDPKLDYAGFTNASNSTCKTKKCKLAVDLLIAMDDAGRSNTCQIKYKNSNGQQIELSYGQISTRIFKLSFDPYHCVEKRWGADNPEELASCRDGDVKNLWYEREQRLRNQIERTYDARMDYGIDEIHTKLGVEVAPDVDAFTLLMDNMR
jgi:hypothetical protein